MARFIVMAAALGASVSPLAIPVAAQTVLLEPYVITVTRAAAPISEIPFSTRVFDAQEIASAPALTLDGALRSVPGFSLFRRSDSLYAHPTAQGVSMRGLGPSGASRTLVLLDGVPVNDPFGGWIAWNKLPRGSLERVELVRGGGGTAWGSAALGGVVHFVSRKPSPGTAFAEVAAGSFGLLAGDASLGMETAAGVLELSGRAFRTDGFMTVAAENRGPVDIPAGQRHRRLSARLHSKAGEHTELVFTGRVFSEHRGNGTALQNNRSREAFGSIALNHMPGDGIRWTAVVFGQDQEFSSTFSSVNADRSSETPASDQFSVPASAWGLAWTAFLESDSDSSTSAGFDFRSVTGETREDSGFANGSFTRRRIAGGTQRIGGLFVVHTRDLSDTLRLTGGIRADHWSDSKGFRREALISTGEVTRLDAQPRFDGWQFSPSAGVVWNVAPNTRIRAAAQRAFRRPTLNELHRPFRVGAFITESNPSLKTETVTTTEAGISWTGGPFTGSATVFHHDFRDAVANITLVHGPGNFPGFGFVPAGGAGRRRLNVDQVTVSGVELSAALAIGQHTRITADYLFSDALVRRGKPDNSLDGKRIPQVPRHSAVFAIRWSGPSGLVVSPRLRFFSRQFEDDENLLSLAAAAVADVSLSLPLPHRSELFLLVENVANARVETGLTAAGVVNVGTPRLAMVGFRKGW